MTPIFAEVATNVMEKAVDYGIAYAVMAGAIVWLIKVIGEQKTELKESYLSKEKLLIETITTINKNSFMLEGIPNAMKQQVRDAVHEEMASCKLKSPTP